jgi:hypothetical protein
MVCTEVGMKNEEELVSIVLADLGAEIDAEVMASFYRDAGWTEVRIPRPTRQPKSDVDDWCKSLNMVYHSSGPLWLFENEKDAVLFILRWL